MTRRGWAVVVGTLEVVAITIGSTFKDCPSTPPEEFWVRGVRNWDRESDAFDAPEGKRLPVDLWVEEEVALEPFVISSAHVPPWRYWLAQIGVLSVPPNWYETYHADVSASSAGNHEGWIRYRVVRISHFDGYDCPLVTPDSPLIRPESRR